MVALQLSSCAMVVGRAALPLGASIGTAVGGKVAGWLCSEVHPAAVSAVDVVGITRGGGGGLVWGTLAHLSCSEASMHHAVHKDPRCWLRCACAEGLTLRRNSPC